MKLDAKMKVKTKTLATVGSNTTATARTRVTEMVTTIAHAPHHAVAVPDVWTVLRSCFAGAHSAQQPCGAGERPRMMGSNGACHGCRKSSLLRFTGMQLL